MSLAYYARNAASGDRLRQQIQRSGVTSRGYKLWTDAERAILVEFKGNYDEMHRRLPHRTRIALIAECGNLGLRKPKRTWSAEDLAKLRRLYPTAPAEVVCREFPLSSWDKICWVARRHGFRRKTRPYKLTGILTLDEVRAKCFEIKWTMRDLDSAARTGCYFRKAGWLNKKEINHRALGRAIEALDGIVRVQWRE